MLHHRHPYRWVMLGALGLVYFSFGIAVFGMTPLVNVIREDLDLSKGAMGTILGAWPLVFLVAAMPAGALVDRLGLRRSLGIATVIISASALLRPVVTNFIGMFGSVALFGLGGPLVSVGAPKLISVWFDEEERALAMGITMSAPAIGGVLPLVTANSLLMPALDQSWRATLMVYALITVAIIAVWLVAASAGERLAPGVDRDANPDHGFSGARGLLRHRAVQLMLIVALGMFFFNHSLNGWLPTVIEDRGFSSSAAGYLAGAVTALSIVGALLGPRLIPESSRIAVMAGVYAVFAAASILLYVDVKAATLAGLAIIGMSRGLAVPIALVVMMQLPGVAQRNMGAAGGLFFTVGEAGGVTGPILFGVLADIGGFGAGLVLLTGVAGLTGILTLGLRSAMARVRDC
ncbi:CynX/NimT family MFS transporter [Candidatus Poriferisocius sp.]|uniref:MFS transporter n=1 Tax=Candidatus Poriferisocius sp. TaxID=3101276 RepID=UPI003B5237ED